MICKNLDDDKQHENGRFSFEKASFSFEEVMQSRGRLVPDIDWYNVNQLLPPITRLIEQVDGITVDFVAQCLGVDPKKVRSGGVSAEHDENNENALPVALLKTET